jgi:hypothetical protein
MQTHLLSTFIHQLWIRYCNLVYNWIQSGGFICALIALSFSGYTSQQVAPFGVVLGVGACVTEETTGSANMRKPNFVVK